MIVKEARADRWAVLVGVLILALRVLSVVTVNLKAQSLASVTYNFDADFSPVATGHISASSAYVWATFFNDLTLYLLVGVGGIVFGAGLVANEISSGSIFVLLSRPVSRTQVLLTKYGIAAACCFVLCCLSGCLAVVIGAWQGVTAPSIGRLITSIVLLWLGMLFIMSLTLFYSLIIPQALVAGILGFLTAYIMTIVPVIHTNTASSSQTTYLLGLGWSIASYWGSLGIYAGIESPLKSLVIAALAAVIPALVALVIFARKNF